MQVFFAVRMFLVSTNHKPSHMRRSCGVNLYHKFDLLRSILGVNIVYNLISCQIMNNIVLAH